MTGERPLKKRAKKLNVQVSYDSCTILTNLPMVCPLCGIAVEPMVEHNCSRPRGEKSDG